jgi:hypothetical protein
VEASEWFLPENYAVLEDPRVRLVTADARNFLLATTERYDLIVSEPSNPWISGVSNLFTAEFFELAHGRLAPGGLMTQWFHTYSMSVDDFRTVLGTFAVEFNYVSIWRSLPGDLVMVGSDEPHGLVLGRLDWTDPEQPLTRELQRAGIHSDHGLVRLYQVGGAALRQFTSGARLNSDRLPVVEFSAPRNLYAATEAENLEYLYGFLGGKDLSVPVRRLLALTDNAIEATAFGVTVEAPAGGLVEVQSAHWLLSHRRFDQGLGDWGVGTQRRLVWQEGSEGVYLQAEWRAEAPGEAEFDGLLQSLLIGEQTASGGVTVPGQSSPARWAAHTDASTGRMRNGLAWSCVAPTGGHTVVLAATSVREGSESNWERQRDEFADRFRCR